MREKLYIEIILLSLIMGGCAASSNFDVKTVDATTRSPISEVLVNQRIMHYTSVKSLEQEKLTLGKTDRRGVLNVKRLNMNSRDHTLSFSKTGYEKMDLVIRILDGKQIGIITKQLSEREIYHLTIRDFTVVTIPMPRK